MIKSLPLFRNSGSEENTNKWRRIAGMMRAEMLISQDAYTTIMRLDSTANERERALSRIINYTHRVTYFSSVWRRSKFDFVEFINNDENWQ